MKKIIKKQPRIGNLYKILLITYLLLTLTYLIENVLFFIFPHEGLHYVEKGLFLYLIKWGQGVLIIIGILEIRKHPNLGWVLLNSVPISVLFLWHLSFMYYTSDFDNFLLEFVSLALIITTNQKSFLETYSIERVLKCKKNTTR